MAAAVAVIAVAVVMEELLRSGTVGGGWSGRWWGQVVTAAVFLAGVGSGLYFLRRAYRS